MFAVCVSRCISLVLGLRGIERVTEIHHTTVMNWIREAGHQMSDAPQSNEIPEVTDLDEMQTFALTNAIRSGFGQQSTINKLEF